MKLGQRAYVQGRRPLAAAASYSFSFRRLACSSPSPLMRADMSQDRRDGLEHCKSSQNAIMCDGRIVEIHHTVWSCVNDHRQRLDRYRTDQSISRGHRPTDDHCSRRLHVDKLRSDVQKFLTLTITTNRTRSFFTIRVIFIIKSRSDRPLEEPDNTNV